MKIRQAVVLAGASGLMKDRLHQLEQLGVQISIISPGANYTHTQTQWTETLLVSANTTSPAELDLVRRAADEGLVALDPDSLDRVINELKGSGEITEDTWRELSASALFSCIQAEARKLASLQPPDTGIQRYLVEVYQKVQDMRYGENWHQKASLYRRPESLGLYQAAKLNGKAMSYNNMVDAETVLEMLMDLSHYDGDPDGRPLSVIVKHANPCGVAYGRTLAEAYRNSFATDPKSAFGGVIGFDRPVDRETAEAIGDSFVEVLLAPGFDEEAMTLLTKNKPNRRILDTGNLMQRSDELYRGYYARTVFGGLLVQDYDRGDISKWETVTQRKPSPEEDRALRFAWKVSKFVKSNALVYATEDRTIGIGSGQVSRVDSARFGAEKAQEHGLDTKGTVAATDSFFPFRDGLDRTFEAGATAVVHPGGSIRDQEVIEAADEHGMAMVFTGMRHFRH